MNPDESKQESSHHREATVFIGELQRFTDLLGGAPLDDPEVRSRERRGRPDPFPFKTRQILCKPMNFLPDTNKPQDDDERPSPASVRWPLAICCIAIAALHLVPAAMIYAEWRFESGVLGFPQMPPPVLECAGLSACGIAFFSMAVGLLYRRYRNVVWGLILFLATTVSVVAFALFFRAT